MVKKKRGELKNLLWKGMSTAALYATNELAHAQLLLGEKPSEAIDTINGAFKDMQKMEVEMRKQRGAHISQSPLAGA